jgi:hypothetical protein
MQNGIWWIFYTLVVVAIVVGAMYYVTWWVAQDTETKDRPKPKLKRLRRIKH